MLTAEQLRTALKARGMRMTPQRQLILDAILSMHGHIAAEQVHDQVAQHFPDVNISTVYRTLDVLEELGFVRHIHFHDGGAQYQRTDEGRHQHMVCQVCGRDTEIDFAVLEPLAAELRRRYGFQADLAHTAIVGRCRNCQEPA